MSLGLWVTQSAANRSYAASWWPVASPKCEVSLRHVRLSHKDWTGISLDRAVVPLAGVERLWRGRLSESTHSNPDVQNCLDGAIAGCAALTYSLARSRPPQRLSFPPATLPHCISVRSRSVKTLFLGAGSRDIGACPPMSIPSTGRPMLHGT